MSHISVDGAIQQILTLGRGALLAKNNIKRVFRLLPVHPAERHILAMEWQGGIYT